jgi:hypothetical protein
MKAAESMRMDNADKTGGAHEARKGFRNLYDFDVYSSIDGVDDVS